MQRLVPDEAHVAAAEILESEVAFVVERRTLPRLRPGQPEMSNYAGVHRLRARRKQHATQLLRCPVLHPELGEKLVHEPAQQWHGHALAGAE